MNITISGFCFGFMTPNYEKTVAFYRDDLGFALTGGWDFGPDSKGAIFDVAGGNIEIILSKQAPTAENTFLMIEVDDADQFHQRIVEKQIPVVVPLQTKPWGHRNFAVTDPNGIRLSFLFQITRLSPDWYGGGRNLPLLASSPPHSSGPLGINSSNNSFGV